MLVVFTGQKVTVMFETQWDPGHDELLIHFFFVCDVDMFFVENSEHNGDSELERYMLAL